MTAPTAQNLAATASELKEAIANGQKERIDALLEQLANVAEALDAGKTKRVQPMVEARKIPAEQRGQELAAVFEQSLTVAKLSGNAQRSRIASRLKLPARRVRAYQSVLSLFKAKKP